MLYLIFFYRIETKKNESKPSVKHILDAHPIPSLILIQPLIHGLLIFQHLPNLIPING